ncbi:unnamed protein product [Cochlearia groenlandica]
MRESVFEKLTDAGLNFGIMLVFFSIMCGLYICGIKCYNSNSHDDDDNNNNNNDHTIITINESTGIKPNVIQSIPIVDFDSKDLKDNVQCVVCLYDLVDGEKSKVLPTCNHWFHAYCIDSWLISHSTCPICRKRVDLVQRA